MYEWLWNDLQVTDLKFPLQTLWLHLNFNLGGHRREETTAKFMLE